MGWDSLVASTRRAANRMLGGVSVTAGALSGEGLLDMKSQLVMDDAVVSVEYALTVEASVFGSLQYGDTLYINPIWYRVRQEPILIGDGSDCVVMLEKMDGAPVTAINYLTTSSGDRLITNNGDYLRLA